MSASGNPAAAAGDPPLLEAAGGGAGRQLANATAQKSAEEQAAEVEAVLGRCPADTREDLGQLLAASPTLTAVDLSGAEISDADLAVIAAYLRLNTALKEMNLLGSAGAEDNDNGWLRQRGTRSVVAAYQSHPSLATICGIGGADRVLDLSAAGRGVLLVRRDLLLLQAELPRHPAIESIRFGMDIVAWHEECTDTSWLGLKLVRDMGWRTQTKGACSMHRAMLQVVLAENSMAVARGGLGDEERCAYRVGGGRSVSLGLGIMSVWMAMPCDVGMLTAAAVASVRHFVAAYAASRTFAPADFGGSALDGVRATAVSEAGLPVFALGVAQCVRAAGADMDAAVVGDCLRVCSALLSGLLPVAAAAGAAGAGERKETPQDIVCVSVLAEHVRTALTADPALAALDARIKEQQQQQCERQRAWHAEQLEPPEAAQLRADTGVRAAFVSARVDAVGHGAHWNLEPVYAGEDGRNTWALDAAPVPYELLFAHRRREGAAGAAVVPTLAGFKRNLGFAAGGMLAHLEWDNVFLAGGAVLAALMPVPPRVAGSDENMEQWFRGKSKMTIDGDDDGAGEVTYENTPAANGFGGDIDLFVHGLDRQDATSRLDSIIEQIQRAHDRHCGHVPFPAALSSCPRLEIETGRHNQAATTTQEIAIAGASLLLVVANAACYYCSTLQFFSDAEKSDGSTLATAGSTQAIYLLVPGDRFWMEDSWEDDSRSRTLTVTDVSGKEALAREYHAALEEQMADTGGDNEAENGHLLSVRTDHAVTLVTSSLAPHVQIVLRIYSSPAEVLAGFDVDSCCVGFDGERAWCAPRARRAICRGFNLVDPGRLSPTYEIRLAKYARRGFAVAVPGFRRGSVDAAQLMAYKGRLAGLAKLLRMEAFDLGERTDNKRGAAKTIAFRVHGYESGNSQSHGADSAAVDPAQARAVVGASASLSDYESAHIPVGVGARHAGLLLYSQTGNTARLRHVVTSPGYATDAFYLNGHAGGRYNRENVHARIFAIPTSWDTDLERRMDDAWLTDNPGGQLLTGSFNPARFDWYATINSFRFHPPTLAGCAAQIGQLQGDACQLVTRAWRGCEESESAALADIISQAVLAKGLRETRSAFAGELAATLASGTMQERAAAIRVVEHSNSALQLRLVELPAPIPQADLAAAKAAMQRGVLLQAFDAPAGDASRGATLASYVSVHGHDCARLKQLCEAENAVVAAAASPVRATAEEVAAAILHAREVGLRELSPAVARGAKLLGVLVARSSAAPRIAALLATVAEQRSETEPAFPAAESAKRASDALELALRKLREGAQGPDSGALVASRDSARKALIAAMVGMGEAAAKVTQTLAGALAVLEVALADLRAMLHETVPRLQRDTADLFAGEQRAEIASECSEDESKGGARSATPSAAPAALSDALARQLAAAKERSAATTAFHVQLTDAVLTLERCEGELPRLQGWEASQPDVGQLQGAQYAVEDARLDLQTAKTKLATAKKRGHGDLASLQAHLDAARRIKLDAEAQLSTLRDGALESIGHFVEIAAVVCAGVPAELMHLWHPHRQLSDFSPEELPGGRHRIFKVDSGNSQPSVLKEFPCIGDQRKYFFRELSRMHQLQHPCVMEIEAMFIDEERSSFFVQMPFCRGGPVHVFVRDCISAGETDGSSIRVLLQRVVQGIEYLHARGVIHADVKPANILVDEHGCPRLTDFETSRSSSTATSLSKGGGTLEFMAPELRRDGATEPTTMSDAFALGKTLDSVRSEMTSLRADVAGLEALDNLISQLVHEEASERPTAAEALHHPYFTTDAVTIAGELISKAQADVVKAEEQERELGRRITENEAKRHELHATGEQLRQEQLVMDADAARTQEQARELQLARVDVEKERLTLLRKLRSFARVEHAQQYEWLDEHGNWIAYPTEANHEIIVASAAAATCKLQVAGHAYSVTTQFPMFQTNERTKTHRHVRLAPFADGAHVEARLRAAPLYWCPGTCATARELVLLDRRNPSMRAAWDDVESRAKSTVPGMNVLEVAVLHDPLRWRSYSTTKDNLSVKLAGGANEQCLFHAGSESSVSNIAANGFLRDYNNVAAYGTGTYFARDASYSARDRYSPPNNRGEKFMYLARVLVGEPCVGGAGMAQPAAKPGSAELHDSMVDDIQNPQIFVLSAGSDEHAYPEFLIKFK